MNDIEISFPGMAPADAGRLAESLATFVKQETADVGARVSSGHGDAMDFGTTMVLALGTPAAIALARGIADWIRRQGDPDLVIKTRKGSVTVKGGLDLATKREIILAALDKGDL